MKKLNKFSSDQLKKVLLSTTSVFLAIILLGYSAFAWFALTSEITATGMNLSLTTTTGLEISTEENGTYSDHISVNLKEVVSTYVEDFDPDKDSFYLMPASSYDGTNLWYTTSSNNFGNALCAEDEFSKGYGIKYYEPSGHYEGHYVDITFWLRSASTAGCKIAVNQDTTNVTQNVGVAGSEDDEIDANLRSVVRMAFLTPDGTAISDGTDEPLVYSHDTPDTALSVLTDNGSGVSKFTTPEYLKFGADHLSTRTVCDIGGADYGDGDGLEYGKTCITVRIWLEGQDSKCVASIGGQEFQATIGLTAVDE